MIGTSGLLAPIVHGFGKIPKELADGKSIYDLQGTVKVDGKKATMDTFIKANALIETGSNSFVIFAVGKDAHILRENSRMQLSGKNLVEDGLRLITGKAMSVFGKRAKGQTHTIKTTTATIGIRGTGVYTESYNDRSYVCTCYGSTQIRDNQGGKSQESITSKHHDAPRFILADGPPDKLIIPAPMINHTDEELMIVEAIVGRETPFSSIQGYSRPRKGY